MNTNPDRAIDPIGILKLNALVNRREPNVGYLTVTPATVGYLVRR